MTTLDVREDLRQGRAPFDRILAAARDLGVGETFRLLAPIEPVPLFHALGRQGLDHTARQTPEGDWEVLFTRRVPAAPSDSAPEHAGTGLEVDARGLEPPEPMVRILEATATLAPGVTLRARTERRPLHLLAELSARGFTHRSEEAADGSFITHIDRA